MNIQVVGRKGSRLDLGSDVPFLRLPNDHHVRAVALRRSGIRVRHADVRSRARLRAGAVGAEVAVAAAAGVLVDRMQHVALVGRAPGARKGDAHGGVHLGGGVPQLFVEGREEGFEAGEGGGHDAIVEDALGGDDGVAAIVGLIGRGEGVSHVVEADDSGDDDPGGEGMLVSPGDAKGVCTVHIQESGREDGQHDRFGFHGHLEIPEDVYGQAEQHDFHETAERFDDDPFRNLSTVQRGGGGGRGSAVEDHTRFEQWPSSAVSHGRGRLHPKAMSRVDAIPHAMVTHVTECFAIEWVRPGFRRETSSVVEHFDAQMAQMYRSEAAYVDYVWCESRNVFSESMLGPNVSATCGVFLTWK